MAANLDAQIKESQDQVAEAQAKIAELTSRIETARTKMKSGDDIAIDIENATLDDVHAHTQLMNANIAELIMGLDDVTAGVLEGLRRDAHQDRLGELRRRLLARRSRKACARSGCAPPIDRRQAAGPDRQIRRDRARCCKASSTMLNEQKTQGRDQPDRDAGRPRGDGGRAGAGARRDPGDGPEDHRAGEQDRARARTPPRAPSWKPNWPS